MKSRITIIVLILFSFFHCSSLQLDKHDGFWEWFIGKPGFINTMEVYGEPRKGQLIGNRHPIYLWLRTPEILFNPQGGIYYPDMIIEGKSGKFYNTSEKNKFQEVLLEDRNMEFHIRETGLIDFLLMYREMFDPSGDIHFVGMYCVLSPFFGILYLGKNFIPKLVAYPIHDVIKTVMIPVAAVYYTIKTFGDEEEKSEGY
ncbi:MAG: hypothetical protein KDK90_27605 [Leptospiraceae bacterium]|nr:hypothetical protein [Leptospiraceae bacterium]